jgi:hypothetical protein
LPGVIKMLAQGLGVSLRRLFWDYDGLKG